ncbi:hypothetical protein MD484_g8665, partial [Candolleomyces efflorescens]
MHDGVAGAQDTPHQPGGVASDPKVLVASTVVLLILAGTAYVWRHGSGLAHAAPAGTTSQTDISDKSKAVSESTANPRLRRDVAAKARATSPRPKGSAFDGEDIADDDDAAGSARNQEALAGSLGKSSRAKERRKRGKDPLKELLKPGGGKLAKAAAEVPLGGVGLLVLLDRSSPYSFPE